MTWAVVADFHEYLDWKEQTDLFSDVMVYNGFQSQILTEENSSRSLTTHTASANYLRTLGLHPVLGRDLTEEDTKPNAAPVALIGYALWQAQFAGDPAIIGRTLHLSGKLVTVVGVLPKAFTSVSTNERPVEALLPLTITRESSPRGNHFLWVYARLKDGVSLEQARARMGEVAVRLQKERDISHGIVVFSLQEWNTEYVRPRLFALMGAVALVLLIACVNLANLQLVRITGRTAEISVKMAIGAGRWRVARELLAESLLLGVAGGLAGAALAFLTIKLAGGFIQTQFSTYTALQVGPAALAFSGGHHPSRHRALKFPAGLARHGRVGTVHALHRPAAPSPPPQQRRLNNLFVVAQVGLTLVVLVCAGLLVRSMHRLTTQDRGFSTDNLITFRVDLPAAGYGESAQRVRFFSQLLERVRALPGVEAATVGDSVPLRTGTNGGFSIMGHPWARGQEPLSDQLIVAPGYFQTFGITLDKGRDFDAALDQLPDQDGHFSASIIINESMARKYFAGKDPVGQPIGFSGRRWQRAEGLRLGQGHRGRRRRPHGLARPRARPGDVCQLHAGRPRQPVRGRALQARPVRAAQAAARTAPVARTATCRSPSSTRCRATLTARSPSARSSPGPSGPPRWSPSAWPCSASTASSPTPSASGPARSAFAWPSAPSPA